MIIYQRSAGARLSFGVQVIFQTRMTRMTRILFSFGEMMEKKEMR